MTQLSATWPFEPNRRWKTNCAVGSTGRGHKRHRSLNPRLEFLVSYRQGVLPMQPLSGVNTARCAEALS